MKTKAVFFDLGGTLLVMRRDRIFKMVLAEEGRVVDLERVHSSYLKVEPWWLSTYGNKVLSPEETNEAYRDLDAKIFMDLYPSETSDEAERLSRLVRERWPVLEKLVPLELYPDAQPALDKLSSEGYSLGLVSNAPPDTAKVVETLGLPKFMKAIVISGVVGYSKPHPEIFRIALREAGVRPGEAIHVGDLYEADVLGARSAGIEGVLIDREGRHRDLECPQVRSLMDVCKFIR